MKKSLVLAMAMALGVTASAYAANPFSDVPAGHWAYDSVAKLAAAGVVDGYADGAFDGEKLMTRYEMAQIVAKAMAKGADCDKLAAEFADELDTLGVRVAKLEKAADNVKISGFLRLRYRQSDLGGDHGDMRSRIFVTGQVNDDWSYTGMIQNDTVFTGKDGGDSAEEDTNFKRAYLDGKIGGVTVRAGRWDEIPNSGAVLDAYVDGVKAEYGKDIKVWGVLSKAATDSENLTVDGSDRVYIAGVESKVGPVDVYGTWYKASEVQYGEFGDEDAGYNGEKEIYNIGLGMNVAKDTRLTYEYMWGDDEYNEAVSKDGYIVGLNYKGADTGVVGTYGLHAYYYDQPVNAWLCPTFDLNAFSDQGGYEGWSVGADYTVAKNVLLSVNYYDTEAKVAARGAGKADDQRLYSELYFFF